MKGIECAQCRRSHLSQANNNSCGKMAGISCPLYKNMLTQLCNECNVEKWTALNLPVLQLLLGSHCFTCYSAIEKATEAKADPITQILISRPREALGVPWACPPRPTFTPVPLGCHCTLMPHISSIR